MTHEQHYEKIDDYVGGKLDDAERAAFEQAMEGDAALRGAVEAAHTLEAEVEQLPRSLQPPRDLWPEIAERIEKPERTVHFGRFRGRRPRYSLTRYLVAAAALLVLLFGMPVMMNRSLDQPAPPTTAARPDPEIRRVATQYLEARQELLDVLKERRGAMAPETRAVVEDNLAIIASAVEEIETALAQDEDNRELERMLHAAYQSEVHLLRRAVELTEPADDGAETPEGEHDEA